jgi:hypothetical protein
VTSFELRRNTHVPLHRQCFGKPLKSLRACRQLENGGRLGVWVSERHRRANVLCGTSSVNHHIMHKGDSMRSLLFPREHCDKDDVAQYFSEQQKSIATT